MTHIRIIGNSHVAAFKGGWDNICDDYPDFEVSFFASSARHSRHFKLGSDLSFGLIDRAAPLDAIEKVEMLNGAAFTDLTEPDIVIVAGIPNPTRFVPSVVSRFSVDGLVEHEASQQLSRAAFNAFCVDMIMRAMPTQQWLNWPDNAPRLILNPTPNPSADCANDNDAAYNSWISAGAYPDAVFKAQKRLNEIYQKVLDRYDISLLRQPRETLLRSGMTNPEYSVGSRRIINDEKHPANDYGHMNADYGALILTNFLNRLSRAAKPDQNAVAANA